MNNKLLTYAERYIEAVQKRNEAWDTYYGFFPPAQEALIKAEQELEETDHELWAEATYDWNKVHDALYTASLQDYT